MSDHSFTSTRLMAQSAAQKAQDAYAVARDAKQQVEAMRAEAPVDEPDFGQIFNELDRRLEALELSSMKEKMISKALHGIGTRLSILEKQATTARDFLTPVKRSRGRPRKQET